MLDFLPALNYVEAQMSLAVLEHRLFESMNPFPNKPWFLCVCSTRLLKTLWEKEKLLEMSNFSFSHNVFYPCEKLSARIVEFETVVCKLFLFGRIENLSCGKGLNQLEYLESGYRSAKLSDRLKNLRISNNCRSGR